eukprot:Seg3809.1 transcript_id=Seg3809.1/GoldUCD/mRNA.D3Y31 product="Choline dehydrogenase mitochondrial" protein_id=Seg3809.1/GoldUCD/D3Y31
MPSALQYNLSSDRYNWHYMIEPQKHMDNRKMYWPRGRVWGGSSALNAMVYIRGHAYDYDGWETAGAKGWSYADCLPYFKKAQTHELGENDYRGGSGPLHVSRGKMKNPLFHAFIDAAQQCGYPYTEDLNGYQQEGVGPMDMTTYKGKRWSAAQAYLRPALKRKNLKTETKALVNRVLFEGTKAVGVEYVKDSQIRRMKAKKEVILSGGAINSPQLLMLSGIGNSADLKQHGIPVVLDKPGVGQNLQDHLEMYIQHECKKPITLYKSTKLWNMGLIGIQWLATHTGLGASSHLESGGFIRSKDGLRHPDIQFHFLPSAVIDHGRIVVDREAFQLHVGTLRATSRGSLKLRSANAFDHPIIDANYLATEEDRADMRACVRLTREIFAQKAFDEFRGPELQPGSHVQSDEEIDAFVRQKGDSAYHPSCTCKMGDESDPMAVVDNNARVIGAENLRVVDASIMPNVASGNLNGPTIMLAEKLTDAIRGKEPLPRSNAAVYETPMTGQR